MVPVSGSTASDSALPPLVSLRQPAEQHGECDESEDTEQSEQSELAERRARKGVAGIGDDFAHTTSGSAYWTVRSRLPTIRSKCMRLLHSSTW